MRTRTAIAAALLLGAAATACSAGTKTVRVTGLPGCVPLYEVVDSKRREVSESSRRGATAMPRVSKLSATKIQEFGPVTDRREEMNGYTVEFVSFAADADLDGPLQALPGGACQCPHWGYVIAGRVRFTSGDQEEVYEAGDAFYQPPGHRPYVDAGTELLQFSPTEKLAKTERAIEEWMSRQQGGTP